MVIVVMGVSACGKSTVGRALAAALGWDFKDGDDLHPQANIEKMHAGHPLTDADRWPWLDRIVDWIDRDQPHGRDAVVACSALRRAYRDRLRQADAEVRFVFLDVPRAELERRLASRHHFMPASLLDSQLQTLERPDADEAVLTVTDDPPLAETIERVRAWLGSHAAHGHGGRPA